MKIAIFENDLKNRETLLQIVTEFNHQNKLESVISVFENATDLTVTNDEYDVLFIEMETDEFFCLYVAEKFHLKHPKTNIIYLANHVEYAIEAIHYYASGFLLKPIEKSKVFKLMNKMLQRVIIIKFFDKNNIKHHVNVKNIIMIEANGRNSVIYLLNKTYETRMSLKEWTNILSEFPFAECSRGIFVNFEWILQHDPANKIIHLKNEHNIRLTRDIGRKFIEKYYEYLDNR